MTDSFHSKKGPRLNQSLEMSETVHSLSTSGFARQQIQRWSDALTDLCGRFDIDPLEASSLEGRINYTTVACLKLCQIEASQHRICHTNWRIRSTHPYIKILFQTVGISYFEQDGRLIEVAPGDCLAYDVSCPHTITNPMLTRHEVVIVPRAAAERGFHSEKMSACKLPRAPEPAGSHTSSCMLRLVRRRDSRRPAPPALPSR